MKSRAPNREACPDGQTLFAAQDLPFDQIETHSDALVVPFRRGHRTGPAFHAGVFRRNGDVLPNTELRMLHRSAAPTKDVRDAALDGADQLDGTWLFCGIASAQIGHIITRAMGMLWAVQDLPEDVGLLFVSMMYKQDDHPFLTALLEQAGITNRYRILCTPTRVDRLMTAPDLFSEMHSGAASPSFVSWAREHIIPDFDKRRRRKLYLTRGQLSPRSGRFLNEDKLEALLKKDGYDIVAPETLSLSDQFKIYAEADTVIAAEGSALHMVCMALRPESRLVVIQRRSDVPVLMKNQIASFCEADVHYVDAIDRVFWPEERADNVSLVRMDFEKLRDALADCGALGNTPAWQQPSQDEEHASLHAGRPEAKRFLSDDERLGFLKELRRQRRMRRRSA